MKNDEKMCPLTKMTCYGKECGLWDRSGRCAIAAMSDHAKDVGTLLNIIGRTLEDNR